MINSVTNYAIFENMLNSKFTANKDKLILFTFKFVIKLGTVRDTIL